MKYSKRVENFNDAIKIELTEISKNIPEASLFTEIIFDDSTEIDYFFVASLIKKYFPEKKDIINDLFKTWI